MTTIRPYDEVQAEIAAAFEARRQAAISEMPAQPDAEFLVRARSEIADLFDNAVDWLSYNQSDPKLKPLGRLCPQNVLAIHWRYPRRPRWYRSIRG